ncbi:MAG: HupE/UreJ family protein [Flavobacteriaceae bacterium]|nr:HupE/UreJ family protein [Flavobacteriaceae bacterium]MCY4217045.1 HupE/UreJ family protein [Flavobacteriaceae bacterium]MCY4253656.1 HupE/UreJ family protein [Flavobacteriaceae bacterium]
MLDQLIFFLELGFFHVLDFKALDHVLFLIVLALPFALKHWKDLIIIVSLFTIGHTISMFIVYVGLVPHSNNWIELLISLSIVVVATKNIFANKKSLKGYNRNGFYWIVTFFFGTVHGLGFGSFYRLVTPQGEAFESLVGFALGVEAAQLLVVSMVVLLNSILNRVIKLEEFFWILLVSALVLIQATRMAIGVIIEF